MKTQKWKVYLFFIAFTQAVGGISALLTKDAVKVYNETVLKPPLSPPAIVFPIVWVILYTFMAISAAMIYDSPPSTSKREGLLLYFMQLFFNFFWSIIFFNFSAYGFAFLWIILLWALIILMILSFKRVKPFAALLQIPYLIWVTFAAYLNFGVWLLN